MLWRIVAYVSAPASGKGRAANLLSIEIAFVIRSASGFLASIAVGRPSNVAMISSTLGVPSLADPWALI